MADRLTAEQIEELERLEKAAKDGPWFVCRMDDGTVKYIGQSEPSLVDADGDKWHTVCINGYNENYADDDGAGDRLCGFWANLDLVVALRNAAPALLAAARENAALRRECRLSRPWLEIGTGIFADMNPAGCRCDLCRAILDLVNARAETDRLGALEGE